MTANRLMQLIRNHSTDTTPETLAPYGGTITFKSKDDEDFFTFPLDLLKEYTYFNHPSDYFKVDGAPASTRITMAAVEDLTFSCQIEIAVSGTSTGWIKITDLNGLSDDPEGNNIIAPGVILLDMYGQILGANKVYIRPNH